MDYILLTPPLLVVVGETASGKSSLALQLATKFNGEIICADSWTVYKDFTIGTAKPSPADQLAIRHHLLDIADPAIGFSAAQYKQLADAAISSITQRGKLPILVGGTGLYVDSVLYNYQFLPAPEASFRQELNQLSIAELLQRAVDRGLDTAAIDIGNKRRIIRLIENNGMLPTKQALRSQTLLLGLQTDRTLLEQRITERVDNMLQSGLQQEVTELAGRYSWEAEPMKGIGYREFKLYLSGAQTIEQTRSAIIRSTMALAKKQRTWFKRNKSIQWLTTDDKLAEAVDIATSFLNK